MIVIIIAMIVIITVSQKVFNPKTFFHPSFLVFSQIYVSVKCASLQYLTFSQNEFDKEEECLRLWMEPIQKIEYLLNKKIGIYEVTNMPTISSMLSIYSEMSTPKSCHDMTTPMKT